jgi:hypothetical protein
LVVVASRTDALADCAWPDLCVSCRSGRHHRSSADAHFDRPDFAQRNLRRAFEIAGGIGLCYFVRSTLSAAGSLLNFSVVQHCVRDLRIALLNHMIRLSADYHEQTPTGEKVTRMEHDVDEIANLGADTANQTIRALLLPDSWIRQAQCRRFALPPRATLTNGDNASTMKEAGLG